MSSVRERDEVVDDIIYSPPQSFRLRPSSRRDSATTKMGCSSIPSPRSRSLFLRRQQEKPEFPSAPQSTPKSLRSSGSAMTPSPPPPSRTPAATDGQIQRMPLSPLAVSSRNSPDDLACPAAPVPPSAPICSALLSDDDTDDDLLLSFDFTQSSSLSLLPSLVDRAALATLPHETSLQEGALLADTALSEPLLLLSPDDLILGNIHNKNNNISPLSSSPELSPSEVSPSKSASPPSKPLFPPFVISPPPPHSVLSIWSSKSVAEPVHNKTPKKATASQKRGTATPSSRDLRTTTEAAKAGPPVDDEIASPTKQSLVKRPRTVRLVLEAEEGEKRLLDDILPPMVQQPAAQASPKAPQPAAARRKAPSKKALFVPMPHAPDDVLWTTKYAPRSEEMLRASVFPKKISSVQEWLQSAFSHPLQHRLLCMTGPTGCGKTETVRLLARKLQAELVEWICPTSCGAKALDAQSMVPYSHELDELNDFLLRSDRYHNLGGASQASTARQPRVILVEDLPQLFFTEHRDKFAKIIQDFLHRGRFPMVLIVSDESQETPSLWRYLPVNVLSSPRVTTVAFNAITELKLSKVLNEILANEAPSMQVTHPGLVETIASSCCGDLRHAIQTLQLLCTSSAEPGSALPHLPAPSKPHAVDFNRDSSYGLFHVVGKFLNASKHEPVDFQAILDHRLSSDAERVFTDFLYGNYLSFYSEIEDCAALSDYASDADILERAAYSQGQSVTPTLENCARHLLARGVVHCNDHPLEKRFRPIYRPQTAFVEATRRSFGGTTRLLFESTHTLHGAENITEYLPFVSIISRQPLSPQLSAMTVAQKSLLHSLTSFSLRHEAIFLDRQTRFEKKDGLDSEHGSTNREFFEALVVSHSSEQSAAQKLTSAATDLEDEIEDV